MSRTPLSLRALRAVAGHCPPMKFFRLLTIANEISRSGRSSISRFQPARAAANTALKWDAINFEAAEMTIRASLSGKRVNTADEKFSRIVRLKPPTDRVRTKSPYRKERSNRSVGSAYSGARSPARWCGLQGSGFRFRRPDRTAVGAVIDQRYVRSACKTGRKFRRRACMTRHTAATWLITDGVVRTVGAVLGHSAASTTLNIYSHAVQGAQPAAVAARRGSA